MGDEILLHADRLCRSFHGKEIVKNVSFSLSRGEVLGLLGPNGAGKTTTMKMLSGILAPNSGTVTYCGTDLHRGRTETKRHIGYLPEEAPLYLDLTVDEFLRYCASIRLIDKAAVSAAVDEAKKRCDLSEVGSRLIGNLSKGYKQRIGIAQAIIHKPAVVILDEPTNGLDPNQIRDVRNLLRELAASSLAIIISTHVLSEVNALCNRVAIMHHGMIAYDERVVDQQQYLTVGFSAPPVEELLSLSSDIISVYPHSPARFTLATNNAQAVAKLLVEKSAQENMGLMEITPGHTALEQLFFDITCNDTLTDNV